MKITKEKLNIEEGLLREWLITNGIGGYASSSIIGANTRKYHGLLVAPLNPPAKRFVILSKLDESIEIDDKNYDLYTNVGTQFTSQGYKYLESFEKDFVPIFKYKVVENILIENNYFDLSHNIYKLAQSSNENMEREIKNENDEERKKTLIYGNLLVERSFHKCGSYFNSREKILGYQSQRKSSLMNVFFEQNEKDEKDFESRTSNSEELIEMIHNKSDFMNNVDRSFLIESVVDSQKEKAII